MDFENLLREIRQALRDAEERIVAKLAPTYPQKTTSKKNSRPQLDFSLGLWIVPDELRAAWLAQYPAIDLEAVLRAAAQEMDGSKKRPPRWTYERWMAVRLRKAQAEAMRRAMTARAVEERTSAPCTNAPQCKERAHVSLLVDGVLRPFCVACYEKENARQLRERPVAKPAAAPPPASDAAIEAHIKHISELLGKGSPRRPTPPHTQKAFSPNHENGRHAAHAAPPEREPGCDDE